MMTFGNFIRLVVVIGWLALFIPQVVRHAAPGLGLDSRSAANGMLAANLGRQYSYDLVRTNGTVRLGTCHLGFERTEQGYQLETKLDLDDLGKLAPGLSLLPQLRDASAREVQLTLIELLDEQQHLKSLAAHGRAFGLNLKADGTIGIDGLRGTYTLGEAAAAPFHLPEIGTDAGQGSDLALNLPPGLKPGDRFTTRLLSPDYANMKLSATTAIFTALQRESISTASGPLGLLKVEMQVDSRVISQLWCDANGTVYRSRQQDGGMELRLTKIQVIGGEIMWPQRSTTP
jgi:hypothetical protein